MADVASAVAYGSAAQGQAVYATGTSTAVWAYSPWDTSTVTAAAGGQAGGSPPAPVVGSGSTIIRGSLTFGTGSAPAAGTQVTVSFGSTLPSVPVVMLEAGGTATGTIQTAVNGVSATGFSVLASVVPTPSQGATVYSVSWLASL
jgi:hypothetical protein